MKKHACEFTIPKELVSVASTQGGTKDSAESFWKERAESRALSLKATSGILWEFGNSG
jgi:hypothetical protein